MHTNLKGDEKKNYEWTCLGLLITNVEPMFLYFHRKPKQNLGVEAELQVRL